MTDAKRSPSPPTDPGALLLAILGVSVDLQRIQRTLADVLDGKAPTEALTSALAAHWRTHGDTHRAVARLLGEQVRAALLQQLHGWRAQLDRQLAILEAVQQQR